MAIALNIRNVLQTVPGFITQVSAIFSTKIIIMRYIACSCWSVDKIGYQSCLAQCTTNMSGIAKCDLVKKKKIHFIVHFNSCRFHHHVYYKLTMACSPVALISSMDRALRPVITKARVRFLVQD